MEWYKNKMSHHHTSWTIAFDAGNTIAADFHMKEYNNYSELYDQAAAKLNQGDK